MCNSKVFMVYYSDWDDFSIDSLWSTKELAEKRLIEIKDKLFELYGYYNKRINNKEKREIMKLVKDVYARYGISELEINKIY